LGGEDRRHHSASDTSSCEFGGDNSRDWVVSTDTDTHEESPENNGAVDGDTEGRTGNGRAESSDDDDDLKC